MNALIKSGFLEQIFYPIDSIVVDYDFRNVSYTGILDSSGDAGYLIFNNATGINYQYSGSKIYGFYNPALSIINTGYGAIPLSIVSGNFAGNAKLKILGDVSSANWTTFVTFKHLETGFSGVSKVIFSSKTEDVSTSGFVFGINGCNRLFYEYNTASSGKRIFTVNQDLDNKNLISLSKIDSTLSIGLYQFNNSLNKLPAHFEFNLLDFTPSNNFYIGGMKNFNSDYRNFSGYIDNFIIFNEGLKFPESNAFARAFFCSGFAAGFYEDVSNSFVIVTGLEFQDVPIATGITGYVPILKALETVNGGVVSGYIYSGISGIIYESRIVEMTGSGIGTSTVTYFYNPSGLIDYGYSVPFGNSKILLLNNFDSSYKEVYSFSGQNNNDLNLIPSFSRDTDTYSIFSTGTGEWLNLYVNGISEPLVSGFSSQMSGDFIISENSISSESFFDIFDSSIYDIIFGSGSLTGLSTGDVFSGSKTFSGSYINNRDLYLNGIKLTSGIDYSGVGTTVVLTTTNLTDGDILVLPRHDKNLSRYTGYNDNNFDTNLNLFDEQIWVNGLRQIKNVDYQKLSNFNLNYSTFSLDPMPDVIYNNDTGYFNV